MLAAANTATRQVRVVPRASLNRRSDTLLQRAQMAALTISKAALAATRAGHSLSCTSSWKAQAIIRLWQANSAPQRPQERGNGPANLQRTRRRTH